MAQGTTPSQTTILPTISGIISGHIGFQVQVRPDASVGPPLATPTGTVTVFDGTTAVGSATLTADSGFSMKSFAQVFGVPDPVVAAAGAVWGDFDGDGRPDLLVYGAGSSGQQGLVTQTFLSESTALFGLAGYKPQSAQQLALSLLLQSGQTLAVLDVDGDGHLDLLAGNTVAYGNGDGSFGRVAVLPVLTTGYSQTYAADMDGDGKMDIVAVDTPPSVTTPGTVQYAFTVFHNDGAGSFTAMGPYPLAPSFAAGSSVLYNIFGLSFADVNGDGRVDVLSQSNAVPAGNAAEPAGLNVVLNLGTGFSTPQVIDTSALPELGMVSTAFGDLNGDGKLDLVLTYQANTGNNGVATLLGNGDGSFAAPFNFPLGDSLSRGSPLLPVVTEDVNGDGRSDVVVGTGVLLLGAGDGTLTVGTPLFTSSVVPGNPPPAYPLQAAPATALIPGGTAQMPALLFLNLQGGANAVFVPQISSGATVPTTIGPGSHTLTAHYSGDSTYAASVSATLHLTIAPFPPQITVASSANPSYTGESVTLTATIHALLFSPAGSMVFSDGTTTLATVPVNLGTASYTKSFSTAADHMITATYSGDVSNAPASGTLTQTVSAPFALSSDAGSTTLTVASGKSVSAQVNVTGASGFSGTVTLSCTGLPAQAACNFGPASVALSGTAAATSTLTISTAGGTSANAMSAAPLRTETIVVCGLPILGLLALFPVRRTRRLLLGLGFTLFLSTAGLTGCGGSQSTPSQTGTPPGSYTFNVVATSDSATATANYTLTVQ